MVVISRLLAAASRPWNGCIRAIIMITTASLAACAGGAPDRQAANYLEEGSGTTLTRVVEPLVLFSDDPAFAANARDYIYVAPLAVNQAGRRSWWLWLGLWSTIDRAVSIGEIAPEDPAGILLIVDGEPMELDAGARVPAIAGVQGMPYATPVATARNLFLPLTGSQVARLGNARRLTLRTDYANRATRVWERWAGDVSPLRAFADLAGANAGSPSTVTSEHGR
jgi:hypothetical protein